jgi:hypothetical protein
MSKHLGNLWTFAGPALALCLIPAAGSSTPIGPIAKIVVMETGIGPESDGCRAFTVTADQVRAFFDQAILISGRQDHDFFLHGPCAARGTFESRYDTWQWEIRNLGTGRITATNGDTFLLGDPSQESSLADD